MAQKTNLNISPYYDDFDPNNNFYKVLFKPGFPVQARELTSSQSLLQNQVQSFGENIFKEGSVVIPGAIEFDNQFSAVKINEVNYGIDISLYIEEFLGKKITGVNSKIEGIVKYIALPTTDDVDTPTIYVTYTSADSNNEINTFSDGEQLVCSDNITYGNTTINSGTPFASLISADATSVGSAAFITEGVYFIRGYFVNVTDQSVILDYYTNTPSYRVGLKIDEIIVSAKQDETLYDNAKGFSNFAAPGADRLKINLTLVKKLIEDQDDTDFVELMRVKTGKIKVINPKSNFNIIRDFVAERTFDESGDYVTDPFGLSVHNSLNDNLGNGGIFTENEKTDQLNTPSDDLMCLKISDGKAYVRGYDIEKEGTTIIDVEKSREVGINSTSSVPFVMGNIIDVNSVRGVAKQGEPVQLFSDFAQGGDNIGSARAYSFNLKNQSYEGDTSVWELRLFDIQTNTALNLNKTVSSTQIPKGSYIKGKNSGASGYSVGAGNNTTRVDVNQTTGNFAKGEQLQVNGVDIPLSVGVATVFDSHLIKSVKQEPTTGYPQFAANTVQDLYTLPNGINVVNISAAAGGKSIVTAPNGKFEAALGRGITLRYQEAGVDTETYSKIIAVGAGGTNLTISGVSTSVDGIFGNTLPSSDIQVQAYVGDPTIKGNGRLYAPLANANVSTVDLSGSDLRVTKQITGVTFSGNSATITMNDVKALYSDVDTASFEPYDEERYSIHVASGAQRSLPENRFSINADGSQITLIGGPNASNAVVNTSIKKNNIKTKIKDYTRSQLLDVIFSKYERSGSIAVGIGASVVPDGLTFDKRYGVRVQDPEISLNHPDAVKLLAVYESVDTARPSLDEFQFNSTAAVQTNAVIGEDIVGNSSKAIARIVSKSASNANSLGIVYLSETKFTENEVVKFQDSKINTNLISITKGLYRNITRSFTLDKGQKEQYYDYSKLIRNKGIPEPNGRLLIIFDHYSVSNQDQGDLFTALSYDNDRFNTDIPDINGIRATDTIDFRPRVPIYDSTNLNQESPFNFSSRDFTTSIKQYLIPNESSTIGYEYYLPRIDRLYLNQFGDFVYEKGLSSITPKAPERGEDSMQLATIALPPYLYNPQDAIITLVDNRRFTMRDIGNIENRVVNLEETTTLSLLETNAQSLQIQDAQGRSRFKTGFFVDGFKNNSLINPLSTININPNAGELIPRRARNTLTNQITPKNSLISSQIDFQENFELFDNKVQKTGDAITLKYEEEVWLGQYYATEEGIVNVNPYELPAIVGRIDLNPFEDVWTNTVQNPITLDETTTGTPVTRNINLDSNLDIDLRGLGTLNTNGNGRRFINANRRLNFDGERRGGSFTFNNSDTRVQNRLISSANDDFMRSRNTELKSSGFPVKTKVYLFIDGTKIEDVIPKLIPITKTSGGTDYGSTSSFQIGETVKGYSPDGTEIINFRLCTPNHKGGPFNNPTETYTTDPYTDLNIQTLYSQSSNILNIDTRSLSEEAQGAYSGYLVANTRLVGQTSSAEAYVKDFTNNKLITDEYGEIIATFFIRDPSDIVPVKITTGNKSIRLTTSIDNRQVPPGQDPNVIFAETQYVTRGTTEEFQETLTGTVTQTNVNITAQTTANVLVNIRQPIPRHDDPVAQTFVVGGNVYAPSAVQANEDLNGFFLTSVEVFFASIDQDANSPITCEIRETTGDARPSRILRGRSKTLYPFTTDESGNRVQNIQFDTTSASIGTKFTFPEPIYLAPGKSYAFVLLAPRSVNYTVWFGKHGAIAVNPQSIPGSTGETTRYSRQYGAGAFFMSQNGSLWTEDQTKDLTFVLHRANFTESQGSAYFNNPDLNESNGYVPTLRNNPITVLPKTGSIGIETYASGTGDNQLHLYLTPGRKISGKWDTSTAVINSTGAGAGTVSIAQSGTNYRAGGGGNLSGVTVDTFNIIGSGSGLKLNITSTNSVITGVTTTTNSTGRGYQTGDVVGIVTSSLGNGSGTGAEFTITTNGNEIDTLYLTNIQGKKSTSWDTAVGIGLSYFKDNGEVFQSNRIVRNSTIDINETGLNSGNILKVDHFNHGMYSATNKVKLTDITSDTTPSTLSAPLSRDETGVISVASTVPFQKFEGIDVNGTTGYIGYVKIGDEIIGYRDTAGGVLTIASDAGSIRGVDNTISVSHNQGTTVEKYELGGVSTRRLEVSGISLTDNVELDHYHLSFDRSANGADRSSDSVNGDKPELSFKVDSFESPPAVGGSLVKGTQNILYSALVPRYSAITPSGVDGSKTGITGSIRTISGTSVDGSENSFDDRGFENIQINTINSLDDVAIVASKINENEYLPTLPRNKSFTTILDFSSNNQYISPIIYLSESKTEFINHRINNPIGLESYPSDNRVNSFLDDPHSSAYYSNTVGLKNPASSLKILISAVRPAETDIRVLYHLIKADSDEIMQGFELFPGFKNIDQSDAFGDSVKDPDKNDGRSDSFVNPSTEDEFLEYQFTADNLDLFIGYTIKIVMVSTSQAKTPKIKELRSIAVR